MLLDSTFYDAFREQARLLVPDRPVLLALVRLYGWLGATEQEAVSEEQLRRFLAQGEADMLTGAEASPYTPWQRHSASIRDLQEYWLLRGVQAGPATYSLRPHGRTFCERLHATLFSKLEVSEVEAAFRLLRNGLGEGDEEFLVWARQLLPQLSANVEQQLVALDNDIETAVVRLRRQTSQPTEDFVEMLRGIDDSLTELLHKASELHRAFAHTTDLRAQLTNIWLGNEQEQAAINQAAQQALRFIDRASQRLGELSQRLSWVHPRVKALFGDLGKLQFDRKTEQYLLAQLHAGPGAVLFSSVAGGAYRPLRFGRVPVAGQVLPTQPVQATRRTTNQPAQLAFQARAEEQLRRRGQVQHWLRELRHELQPAGASVQLSVFGQRLLTAEGAGGYEVLARLLATVRREDEPRRGWQLEVDPNTTEIIENDVARISLWKLTITNP